MSSTQMNTSLREEDRSTTTVSGPPSSRRTVRSFTSYTAAERAVDAKAYLSGGEAKQAIDPSRLEVRTGSGGGQKTEYWLVPAGASFTQADTQPVDETKVKPIPDHPKPAAKKRAKPAQ